MHTPHRLSVGWGLKGDGCSRLAGVCRSRPLSGPPHRLPGHCLFRNTVASSNTHNFRSSPQDGVPRGAYRGTVQLSWRKGKVRLFIAPAPGFRYEKPKGEVLLDSSGAVRKVR